MPSSGVSRCRTSVAGTAVPSGDGKVRRLADVARPGRGRAPAAGAARSARRCAGRRPTRPAGGRRTGRTTVTAVAAKSSLCDERDACRRRRPGRPRPRRSPGRRAAARRSRCRPSRAEAQHDVASANASTRSSRSAGSSARTGSQARWSWSASRGTGHRASRNSCGVVVGDHAAARRCRRGARRARRGTPRPAGGRRPTAAAPRGSWASTTHTSRGVAALGPDHDQRRRCGSPGRSARTARRAPRAPARPRRTACRWRAATPGTAGRRRRGRCRRSGRESALQAPP